MQRIICHLLERLINARAVSMSCKVLDIYCSKVHSILSTAGPPHQALAGPTFDLRTVRISLFASRHAFTRVAQVAHRSERRMPLSIRSCCHVVITWATWIAGFL